MSAKVGNIGGGMVELFSHTVPYLSGYIMYAYQFTDDEVSTIRKACGEYDLMVIDVEKRNKKFISSTTIKASALLKAFSESSSDGYTLRGGVIDHGTNNTSGLWDICWTQLDNLRITAQVYHTSQQNEVITLKIYGIKL